MAKKTVTALIDMVNYIIEHPVRQNIEFTTEVDDTLPVPIEEQIEAAYTALVCNEVQVKRNPDYQWASAYVHRERPEFVRVELKVFVI